MSFILEQTAIMVDSPGSLLSFESKGGGHWKVWDRFLYIKGKPAYHIGNICDTCDFFFTRQDGANQKASAKEVSTRLRLGLRSLDVDLLRETSTILPQGLARPN